MKVMKCLKNLGVKGSFSGVWSCSECIDKYQNSRFNRVTRAVRRFTKLMFAKLDLRDRLVGGLVLGGEDFARRLLQGQQVDPAELTPARRLWVEALWAQIVKAAGMERRKPWRRLKPPNAQFLLSALVLSLAIFLTGCSSTPRAITAELEPLQGYWEGEGAGGKCAITITGNSLHYRVGTNWFKTTFILPAGTDPQQLHATITDCSPPSNGAIGKVVFAIFKIEDGTLTLAEDDMSHVPPKTFLSASSHYNLKKVPQSRNFEASTAK
jgi:hypothetical protein